MSRMYIVRHGTWPSHTYIQLELESERNEGPTPSYLIWSVAAPPTLQSSRLQIATGFSKWRENTHSSLSLRMPRTKPDETDRTMV